MHFTPGLILHEDICIAGRLFLNSDQKLHLFKLHATSFYITMLAQKNHVVKNVSTELLTLGSTSPLALEFNNNV